METSRTLRSTIVRVLATANFAAVLVAISVWYSSSCTHGARPSASTSPARSNVAMAPRDGRLASYDQVADCLDREGGVVRGTCVIPARVRDVHVGARANDRYFAATKAAVPITWSTGAQAVEALEESCRLAPQAQVQQAASPPPGEAADAFACVIAELERRTTLGAR
jgi:hypothetical protein